MMKKVILSTLVVGVAAVGAQAAEETMKYRLITHRLDMTVVPASQAEGHILGVGTLRGVAVFEDGRLADKLYTVTFDYTNGEGDFHGYSTYTFLDGSTVSASFEGQSEAGDDGRVIRGTYKDMTGTGEFEGVSGTGEFVSQPGIPWEKGATLYDAQWTLDMP